MILLNCEIHLFKNKIFLVKRSAGILAVFIKPSQQFLGFKF